MSIFKCKMCGAALEVDETTRIAECEYCGTRQTLPRLDSLEKENRYDRANHLRRSNEFDRASAIYEQIVQADPTDAEAYWSLVLCRYGIEYVEDPVTHRRVPTVNRTQFQPIFRDEDYLQAVAHADSSQRAIYEAEAREIDRIHREILQISQQEEPFDVFICYKETDAGGRRTVDSVLAADLYQALTREGYRVFFSRVTLEDKLGTAYEPYIFAALHSARVMVVLGTRPEHFQAAWVKNEWSRYLALIRNGEKKVLIPAFRDMDVYDLPEEFSHLQAQDLSKLGFMQDLLHGIGKFVTPAAAAPAAQAPAASVESLLQRVQMFLEDRNWEKADEYCEKILDIRPKTAMAYVGKLLASLQYPNLEAARAHAQSLEDHPQYLKAMQFADPALQQTLKDVTEQIKARNARQALQADYAAGCGAMEQAEKAQQPEQKCELLSRAVQNLEACGDYEDARERLEQAHSALERAEMLREKEQLRNRRKAQKRKKLAGILAAALVLAAGLGYGTAVWLVPTVIHSSAVSAMEAGSYEKALEQWQRLEEYPCSAREFPESREQTALALRETGCFDEAIALYAQLADEDEVTRTKLEKGRQQLEQAQYLDAMNTLEPIKRNEEAAKLLDTARRKQAVLYQEAGQYPQAIELYAQLPGCLDQWHECRYLQARELMADGSCYEALSYLKDNKHPDAAEALDEAYLGAAHELATEKDYQKALELYKKSSKFYKTSPFFLETTYAYGMNLKAERHYPAAMAAFAEIPDYRDSAQQHQECKFLYAKGPNCDHQLAYQYLQALIEDQYPGAAERYQELFGWKITNIVPNNDAEDGAKEMTSISVFDPVYFHFTVEGGPPDEMLDLQVRYVRPDGRTGTYEWEDGCWPGSGYWYGWSSGLYQNPAYGTRGKLTLSFYDGDGNLLGESSVNMVT